MKQGDLVVVLGNLDKRVREKQQEGLVIGTLYDYLVDDQVIVILEDMDLWVGLKREIRLHLEQS